MEGNVYVADALNTKYYPTVVVGNKRVLARPDNYGCMFWWERLKVAWKVYKGEYDALKWIGQ